MSNNQVGALVRQPVRLIATRRGEQLMDQVFQHTPIRIGRLLDNDVVLPFDFVSRYHCEIRFENGQWTAIDLGSKNGLLLDGQTRTQEIQLVDGTDFRIQEVSIEMIFEDAAAPREDFHALREAATVIGSLEQSVGASPMQRSVSAHEIEVSQAPRALSSTQPDLDDAPQRLAPELVEPASGFRTSSSAPKAKPELTMNKEESIREVPTSPSKRTSKAAPQPAPRIATPEISYAAAPIGNQPLLDLEMETVLYGIHPSVEIAKQRALQMIVIWHDQLIEAKEVEIGEHLTFDLFGNTHDLGEVRSDKTQIKLPKGCMNATSSDEAPKKKQIITVTWLEPAEFRAGGVLTVRLRYVPKSTELARKAGFIEEKLVNPMLMSTAVHGVTALTALMMAPKSHPPKPVDEPERFATIIISPTPEPVAMLATPVPAATPMPTPIELKPEPPKIVEKEKPKPEVRKVVVQKKLRKVAVMRKEDPAPKQARPKNTEQPKIAAKSESIPMPKQASQPPPPPPEKPAPTPQPFNAKSVGALKMLSMLSTGPASNVANVEKIQISRAPASVPGQMMGREAVSGTGEMISKIAQSSHGANANDTGTVAVGGKNAAGKYEVAGLSGTAGTHKVRGSVVGGATYTELSKNEGLTREQVMKVVQKNQAKIQQCYERSLLDNPDLVGSADFEWEITASGSVSSVAVKNATIKNGENLLGCVKGVFTKMQFPQSKNGESTTSTIGLPFGRL